MGSDIKEAEKNAEEALGLHLWGMEEDNEEIPEATLPPFEAVSYTHLDVYKRQFGVLADKFYDVINK